MLEVYENRFSGLRAPYSLRQAFGKVKKKQTQKKTNQKQFIKKTYEELKSQATEPSETRVGVSDLHPRGVLRSVGEENGGKS